MYPPAQYPVVAAGVEEEFHVVDLATRQLTARAGEVMDQLPADSFSAELQRSVLEANSHPWTLSSTVFRISVRRKDSNRLTNIR